MNYVSVNFDTGERIVDIEHVKLCVRKILTTRVGARVLRRDFGSELPNMRDKNITPSFKMSIFSRVVDALAEHEPRLHVNQVFVEAVEDGNGVDIALDAVYLPTGQSIKMEGLVS